MKRTLSLLLLLILMSSLCAPCLSSCAGCSGELQSGAYRYTVKNGEVTITKYINVRTPHVEVPESIDGMPVVAIGVSAFHGCKNIISLTIPDSVLKIDGLAFSECSSLKTVTLGRGIQQIDFSPFAYCDSLVYNEYESGFYVGNTENPYLALVSVASEDIEALKIHPGTRIVCGSAIKNLRRLRKVEFPEGLISIGSFAMKYCSSLERVYIPKNVKHIGLHVFGSCNALSEIDVSDENQYFKSVDGILFSHDGTRLIKYTAGQNVSSYSIPNVVLIIEDYAFENAKQLTEVVLSDSVEEIGHSAFIHCENLRNIQLGNSLKRIGGQAFGFCSSLTAITIPDSVEELSYSVFSYCDNLESAVIGSGVTQMDLDVFVDCDALREVVFRDPSGWTVIAPYSIFPKRLDLTDPEQNANYLTGEYGYFFWNKN